MRDIGRMVLVLVLICAVAALGLAWVEDLTAERIREEIRQDTLEAIEGVLPAFDNAPDLESVTVGDFLYYPARKGTDLVGLALPVESQGGYGGTIGALLGVAPDGAVTGVQILRHAETPGLGAKFSDPDFLAQFIGKTLAGTRWQVKKDGGDFDQITGATITPRALIEAMSGGLHAYQRDREQVLAAVARSATPQPQPTAEEN